MHIFGILTDQQLVIRVDFALKNGFGGDNGSRLNCSIVLYI